MSSPTAPSTTAHTGVSATSSDAETTTSNARFAVGAATRSDALEIAPSFPVGDVPIEEPLLGARIVEVVVDDLVAERGPGDRPLLERGDRVSHRAREPLGTRLVGVSLERGREPELVLDPVEARRDHRCEREIRVDVAARDPRLDAEPLPVSDDAKAARSVVVPPGERRRRPASRRVALVRVDRRREEDRELLRAGDLPGEEPAEHRRRRVAARKGVAAVAPEARVDMARVADPRLERLGHERDRAAVEERDL